MTPITSPSPMNHVSAVIASGFDPATLIPIAPPDGAMGDRMRPGSAGKVPARLEGDVWQPLADWRAGVDPDWLEFCGKHGANVGLRLGRHAGGSFVALDFDFAPGCERLREIAVKAAQPLALRSTAPHRALALFSLPAHADPGRKAVWKLSGPDGAPVGALEVLAEGQQCVLAGRHHSGNAIRWGDDAAPLVDMVPEVSGRAAVLGVVELVLAALAGAGVSVAERTVASDATASRGVEALAPPSADAVVALLDSLSNPASATREMYLRTMLAARGCITGLAAVGALSDGDEDRIADAAVRWAGRWPDSPGYDAEREKWEQDFAHRDAPLAGWHSLEQVARLLRPGYALEQAQEEFGNAPEPAMPPEDPEAWRNRLLVNDKGDPRASLANVVATLRCAPEWCGVLAYDEFANQVRIIAAPPWHGLAAWEPQEFGDRDAGMAAVWLQENGINVTSAVAHEAAVIVAGDRRAHPVREYLNSLRWDGTARAETWLQRFLGVADTPLHRAFSARFLVAAVARIFQPGCQHDVTLVLEGAQGIRKSTTLETLASKPWFTNHLPPLDSKDAPMQLQGVWLVEMAEFDALGRAELPRAKAFITTSEDRFRPPYGRTAMTFKRQSVFAATINPGARDYLGDESGARRFWPVRCGSARVDTKALAAERDQLWAEAVALFKAGAVWWLDTPELEAAQKAATDERFDEDAWAPQIREIVAGAKHVTADEVMEALMIPLKDRNDQTKKRISRSLLADGWTRERRRGKGYQVRGYRAPGVPEDAEVISLAEVRAARGPSLASIV